MGDTESTADSQAWTTVHHRKLGGIWADLDVVSRRSWGKAARVTRSLPMRIPCRTPLGKNLRVIDRETLVSAANSVHYEEVLPTRTISVGLGETIEAPPLYACRVKRGIMITDGVLFHGILTEDNLLVAEVSKDHGSKGGEWYSFRRITRLPTHVRAGSVVSLLTGGGGVSNYAHWLYDVLPRFHLQRRAGLISSDACFLVPPIDAEFKRTSLQRLAVPLEKCIEVRGPTAIVGDTISASAGHRSHGRVEPWIPEFLRDSLLSETPESGLRLYVNRRDTRIRRILNETALETALAQRGFRSISGAEFDFQDKMDLYNSSDIIVAPHGAGLANIAFCSPGTHVVEIGGDDWRHPWFGDVARAVGLRHTAVSALRAVSPAWLPDMVRHVAVDVDAVIARVDEILN